MAKITTTKALNAANHGINLLTALAAVLATVKAVSDARKGKA